MKAGTAQVKKRNRSIGRILYAGLPRRAIIPLGGPLLDRSSHLPACSDGPPCRHEAGACLFDVAPDRGCRVSPCRAAACRQAAQHGDGRAGACQACPRRRLVSVALFLALYLAAFGGRPLAVTLLCGVRTFLPPPCGGQRLSGLLQATLYPVVSLGRRFCYVIAFGFETTP